MKSENKFQVKARREKLARIAGGELTRIADAAIAEARATMKAGSHTIDAGDMAASANPITRHLGEQMDGAVIDAKISAKVSLDSAALAIRKLGVIDDVVTPEARAEWDRISAVEAELGLVEVE